MEEDKPFFFPFPSIREGQREFMEDVKQAVEGENILAAHAPTGIGKTVAVLVPALQYAIQNDKTVFFLTSKRSQHKIAIDTLRLIKERAKLNFVVVDIISKQSMCPRAKAGSIYREFYSLFSEFCRSEQKNRRCRYFVNRDEEAQQRIRDKIMHVEELYEWCSFRGVCPYKAALEVGESADVLVCDYNYLFSSDIAETVLEKIGKGLEDVIVIVDEAHNLPDRIRNNLSSELRMSTITEAARGLRRTNREIYGNLMELETIFAKLAMVARKNKKEEMNVDRDFLVDKMEKVLRRRIEAISYDDFVNSLRNVAERSGTSETAENTKYKDEALQRNVLNIADFLDEWRTSEKCLRIFSASQHNENPSLHFKLLDPSIVSEPVFAGAHSTIMMSGTLCPAEMYAEILGASSDRIKGKEIVLREYKSPFPEENRLIVVTRGLTTKYTKRGEEMYSKIAGKIAEVAEYVQGGMAVFFPSYALQRDIAVYLPEEVRRKAIVERREMRKEEKNRLYELLREDSGGILLAVQGGSFSEGMDFESNMLKAIIVVGLPLSPPTLEVKTIEGYYAGKYGAEKGKLYGYYYPAITKVLQAAGRGIRSEHDRCIIVLMDYRFAKYPYKNCLPSDYNVKLTDRAEEFAKSFFKYRNAKL
uniref:ATP-dependent DNA helicase n=1 Tax=Candidatus Methanophagaceae archaeon ANME-1 ERB6 TaxID=2759912 RepID=A0A7G9YUH2_9EURY|nr:ATP-dependent DNA helicase [Methanosarcinales archaeon ANME-1 ERB6]